MWDSDKVQITDDNQHFEQHVYVYLLMVAVGKFTEFLPFNCYQIEGKKKIEYTAQETWKWDGNKALVQHVNYLLHGVESLRS